MDEETLILAKNSVDWNTMQNKPFYSIPNEVVFDFNGMVTDRPVFTASDGQAYYLISKNTPPSFEDVKNYTVTGNGVSHSGKESAMSLNGIDVSVGYALAIVIRCFLKPYAISDSVTLESGVYYAPWDKVPTEAQSFKLYKSGETKTLDSKYLPDGLYGKFVDVSVPPKPFPVNWDAMTGEEQEQWYQSNYEPISHPRFFEGNAMVRVSDSALTADELRQRTMWMTIGYTEMESTLNGVSPDTGNPYVQVDEETGVITVTDGTFFVLVEDFVTEEGIVPKGTYMAYDMIFMLKQMDASCQIGKLNKVPNSALETPIPTIPDTTSNYVLKSVAGVLTWVAE